jgi:hypothetical protein
VSDFHRRSGPQGAHVPNRLKPSLPFLWKPYRSASVDDSPPVFKVKDTLQTLSSHPYNANTKFIAFAPNAEYGGKQFTARRVS